VSKTLHQALGLTDTEAAAIERILGRGPNDLELAMYSVMWSEHCSYKSSRSHLGRLPTAAPWVLVGPGENAGVVDVGDGLALAVRIESHNHPSAIEPAQGAATGVGGIIRDIFTMGARPIALLDSLHFGPLTTSRNRWLMEGVVSGIAGYGNSVGVPTVGGELSFRPCFGENPLVNVMCVGLLKVENLVLAQAGDVGSLGVLLGSATGRDGIGGVSVLASACLGESTGADEDKRPSVQVGDPFEEKRLIEACLALYDAGLVTGIQDLGGAGLTCATSETASRGGAGMDVDLQAVPVREPGMTAAEIMTSESQERMLAIVKPADLEAVIGICHRWEVQASVVGRVTAGGRLRITDGPGGEILADVPAKSLHDAAPLYHRPMRPPADLVRRRADRADGLPAASPAAILLAMLVDTSWVWRQYDHQLFLNTVEGPGADAAVCKLKAPGLSPMRGAIAITTDSNSRWCALDPRRGTALVTAEAMLNLACVGARPLAVVNNLNFGNPEHPEVMWQLSEAVDGLAEACAGLGVPVVGGNVSLYNASAGRDIDPTPVVGMVGLIDRLVRRPPGAGLRDGATIVVIGPVVVADGPGRLDGSRWAEMAHAHLGGELPAVDYEHHRAVAALVAALVGDDLLLGVHDVADGGLALALAEMAIASTTGFAVGDLGGCANVFSESPSRVVACVATEALIEVTQRAQEAGVAVTTVGRAGGSVMTFEGLAEVSVDEARQCWDSALSRSLEPLVR